MRFIRRLSLLFLMAYVVVAGLMMYFETSLVFVPTKFPAGDWSPKGFKFEDVQFQAADGTKLHGWFVAADKPIAVVLFCHGNAGNVTHRAEILQSLHNRTGVSVLAFDYRGYGKSEGSANEAGILADARAARTWLAQRTGVQELQIVIMGESLGGTVAADLATYGARALILENTPSSLPDVAAYHFPWLPVRWLMRTQLNAAAKVKSYHGPLFQSHAERDSIVPIEYGKKVFAAANEPKQFTVIADADHNDRHSSEYYDQLRSFLENLSQK